MNIARLVRVTLQEGRLGPSTQSRLARLVQEAEVLSPEDYQALVDLREAVEQGRLAVAVRREFRNVMEELVAAEVDARLAEPGPPGAAPANRRDVVALALNRLPPLYATTDIGAEYQKERAGRELRALVAEQVTEALGRARAWPGLPTGAAASAPRAAETLIHEVRSLLLRFASAFEPPACSR